MSITTKAKQATILFSDIRGFTSISERFPAKQVVQLLNTYFQIMGNIIARYGGRIDKYMGDAIMVTFDTERPEKDSVLNTIACAIEMQNAMEEVNEFGQKLNMDKLFMGIGINTGSVVACTLGSEHHWEDTVIGDQVNVAARVESFCLRGQILISENSYEYAKEYIKTGTVNEVSAKGKKQTIKIYEVLKTTRPKELNAPERDGRRSPRLEVEIPIKFQKIEDKKVLDTLLAGTIRDLSYGGISLQTPMRIDKFSDLRLQVSLSLIGNEISDVYAKVLRVRKVDGQFDIGMEFTTIDEKAAKSLKSFIDSNL